MPRGINPYDQAKIQGRLLTPQNLAIRLKSSLNWWYNADFLTLDASGLVSGATDLSGNNRNGVQGTSGNRLTYFPSDPMFFGRPSFGSTTITGARHLAAPASYFYKHQIFSCYYKDGVDATFDTFSFMSAGTGASGAPRLMGNSGTASLISTSAYATTVSKGGATTSAVVLPLPATTIRADGNSTFSLQIGGVTTSGNVNRVLVGGFRNFVGASAVLTEYEIALIEGCIAWDDGTEDTLIASHPFSNRPPLISD
jgi:hypothetical protein